MFFFVGSLRQNIAPYSDEEMTDEMILDACKEFNLDGYINSLK